MPADAVLAFGPQTFLGLEQRAAVGDERFPIPTRRLSSCLDDRYADLRVVLDAHSGTGARSHIELHYAAGEELDALHAEHLATTPSVDLVPYPTGAHALPLYLKNLGDLDAVIGRGVFGSART